MEMSPSTRLALGAPALVALAFLLAFPAPAASQAAEATAPADLPLLVVEAGTGRPLPGAIVLIPDLDLRLAASPTGLVVFRGIPPGRHEVVVEQFGYLSVRVPVTVPRSSPFRVAISPAPIELEGFLVETDNAMGLGARRRAIPMPVEVLRGEDLAATGPDITDALEVRGVTLAPCPGVTTAVGEETSYCTRFEGRWVPPTLCIDERWLPTNPWQLNRYRPQDLHALELYRGGSPPSVIILGYTHEFVARSLETGRRLSWFVDCAGAPR
jgi:hypothetical protein